MDKIALFFIIGYFINPSTGTLFANQAISLENSVNLPARPYKMTSKAFTPKITELNILKKPNDLSKKLIFAKDCIIDGIGLVLGGIDIYDVFFRPCNDNYNADAESDADSNSDSDSDSNSELDTKYLENYFTYAIPFLGNIIYDFAQSVENYKDTNQKEKSPISENKIQFTARILFNILPFLRSARIVAHIYYKEKCDFSNPLLSHTVQILYPILVSINSLVKTFQTYTFKKAAIKQ